MLHTLVNARTSIGERFVDVWRREGGEDNQEAVLELVKTAESSWDIMIRPFQAALQRGTRGRITMERGFS